MREEVTCICGKVLDTHIDAVQTNATGPLEAAVFLS